jgi:hypothetical protein
MLDDAFNPTVSLDWEVPDEIYWTSGFDTITYTNKNLYNQYWKKFINEVTDKNSSIVKGWFDIRPYDFTLIDFRKVYYFEREYFRLNKIINYNPLNESLTQMEFVKINQGITTAFDLTEADDVYQVDRTPRFVPPYSQNNNVAPNGFSKMLSGGDNRISPTARSYSVVGNRNTIGEFTDGINITGDDNLVTGDNKNVTIIGDGNRVSGSNVTLIDTYDKIINQSDSTYIGGRCVSGGASVVTVTSNKTVTTSGDDDATTYLCDCTSGNITFNLPPASDFGIGNYINIKKIDATANTVTIDGDGSETIDGVATVVISTQYDSFKLQSDGQNYLII